ncbi:peptidoglycan/xylan/chitin deacetylase (PgdA/CDA1 family) [Paenibacillus phyllosphaerae]|uniref:Peptidoglycan/xylan/chitin deacetylase (PgdA/CDA1 family) n=1 Tax=Paenibacillus phyllosphaerae TaxID=274593 RepID=A0A7W5AUF2_9BACL|nr:polysaccharide deacetylase family protein [Paenibacillus phyllosphaerae]MBB3108466.1 peptidoglycan/xylan/chitin deacetylase (PgdA/CDA1 family) [Paenibacillus phyllosphaerae]
MVGMHPPGRYKRLLVSSLAVCLITTTLCSCSLFPHTVPAKLAQTVRLDDAATRAAAPAGDAREVNGQLGKRKQHGNEQMSWIELQRHYPGTFFTQGSRTKRKVALTFDDVPDPRYTPKVLDILAKYKVRATFFVLGSKAAAYPHLVKRMRREGHMIGNHSYDHPVFTSLSAHQFGQQITEADKLLRSLAGYSPRLIRPPYGAITPNQVEWARRNGYTIVNWDVDSEDWRSINSSLIMANIKSTLQPGSIILQHAGGGATQDLSGTLNALPQLIKMLQAKGYEIVTLPELINRPVARTKPFNIKRRPSQ